MVQFYDYYKLGTSLLLILHSLGVKDWVLANNE